MRLLNIDEVSAMLGVTKATIYSWTSGKKIPYTKLSERCLKFKEDEIMNWIEERSVNLQKTFEHKPNKITRAAVKTAKSHDERLESIIRNAKESVLNRNV